jgi:anaerobic dimethyl sulfoxide reductase subunit B (iron-sulfur subunit)
MAKQLAFHIDTSACGNCKACQIACKDKNNLPVGILWRRVFQYGGGSWSRNGWLWQASGVFSYGVSVSCMHCESPACVAACPTQAMTKRADGIVLVNQDQCIGCRYCEWACPYGAPQFDESKGVMTKCNFCEDLLAQGQNPACVDACPMRAIDFGELSELRAKYGNLSAIEPLPPAYLTAPSLVVTPHKNAQLSGQGTGRIMDLIQEV